MMFTGRIALAALMLGQSHSTLAPRDRALSDRLTVAALDQEAALNTDSALTLLRAARDADSTDIVAEFHYVELRQQRLELAALRDEYAKSAAAWDPRDNFCWTPFVTNYAENRLTPPEIVRIVSVVGATTCSTSLLGYSLSPGREGDTAMQIALASRAVISSPAMPILWGEYASRLERSGQTARAEAAWLAGDRAVQHPLLRLQLAMTHIVIRLERGDTAGALALQKVVRASVLHDGRPGMIHTYLSRMLDYRPLYASEGGEAEIINRLLRLSTSRHDWPGAANPLLYQGKFLIDRGEPLRAIPLLSRALRIGDSVRVSDLRLQALTLRGRAYTKAARLPEAERDLRAAVAAGKTSARAYYRADAYHNLAHLYESEGRWREATRTIDRFAALSSEMTGGGSVTTSLLDAGDIRWEAGWHAAADVAYQKMVRVADSIHDWYPAGAYFERTGNLDRAMVYYVRAVNHAPWDAGALAGLTRVHAALGHTDSAEHWARTHDAQIQDWQPLEVPLLPAVLAARGRFAEATRIDHRWADRQVRSGNTRGAAIAILEVAQLLLDAGHPDSALKEALRADSIAEQYNLTRETIRAMTLHGIALGRVGRSGDGLHVLLSALALERSHPAPDLLFESHLALGDAFAALARNGEAIREYDFAAHAVEHSTLNIGQDADRAGFRRQKLRPFDGAIRLLLKSDAENRVDDLVRWSSRRNSAALALSVMGGSRVLAHPPIASGLRVIQRRLGKDEVLLSYIVIDSMIEAIAISSQRAKLLRLPITVAALNARIAAIRSPLVATYSGHIDLLRAPFAMGAAAELYTALIRPFAADLIGKKRIFVAADGQLHALAFDALVASLPVGRGSGYSSAKYLVDTFEVEYLPSPAFLDARVARSTTERLEKSRLLAVGYGAPGSDSEIQTVTESWPHGQSTVLQAGAATESAVRRAVPRFGVVHFAVHAKADGRDPLVSHLVLAADTVEDGYFHTNEIAGAHVNASLVVLSACETAAGPIYEGEGVMGIARAFLASGARAVLGTQWPIGAKTSVLMKEFYRRLAQGEPTSAALREAKLVMRRSPATAHPFYWAGFELVR